MAYIREHKTLGSLVLKGGPDDLTQGDIEKFSAAYRDHGDVIEPNGRLVRAAIAAGWILEPAGLTVAGVPNMAPRLVKWWGREIDALYGAATSPDPKV
jgi:hypothetical protein